MSFRLNVSSEITTRMDVTQYIMTSIRQLISKTHTCWSNSLLTGTVGKKAQEPGTF